jgi:uncharacterized protein (DUF58 family)
MLAPEVIRQIRLLQLRARRSVQSVLGGQYHSAFKGSGISFQEVREYQPGDDIRSIDWNVTARMGQPFLKRYTEERELTVILLIDSSGSLQFGSGKFTKQSAVAELAALIACCAIANQDRIGLIAFGEDILQHLRPNKGLRHVLRLLHQVMSLQSGERGTNLELAMQRLCQLQRRRAIVFLLSDFLAEIPRSFLHAAQMHDLIAVRVTDPLERSWPEAGLLTLRDAENGLTAVIDTANSQFRRSFESRHLERSANVGRQIRGADADLIDISTDGGHVEALLNFFRVREKRRRGAP